MSGEQKGPGLDDQHPKTDILGAPIDFVGDVPTEHTRTDHYDVEWIAAVVTHLGPGAAHPSAQHVVGECGLLYIDESIRVWIQCWQHESLRLVVSFVLSTSNKKDSFQLHPKHRLAFANFHGRA